MKKVRYIYYIISIVFLISMILLAGCQPGQETLSTESKKDVKQQIKEEQQEIIKMPVVARGLYLTGWIAGHPKRFPPLLETAIESEVNAMVINVKDDSGRITFNADIPLAEALESNQKQIGDIETLLSQLNEKNIYTIARIVTFKDPYVSLKKPEWAVQNTSGSVWKDRKGHAWLNPYVKEVWEYNIAVAKKAAELGFKEIQFDYVRFPTDGKTTHIVYPNQTEKSKAQVIKEFLLYANEQLKPYGVFIAADVFGLTGTTTDDMGIGQQVEDIAEVVDYICPMVYPSHYYSGNFGLKNPNAAPYETVYYSLKDFQERIKGKRAKIRPWLQDFSLGVPYGQREVQLQIQAAYDLGIDQWLLWNARNRYTEEALLPEGELLQIQHPNLENETNN